VSIPKQDEVQNKTYNRRDSQMVTHSSTSRPVQCLCMAERTGCPVFTDLWSYVQSLFSWRLYNCIGSHITGAAKDVTNTARPPAPKRAVSRKTHNASSIRSPSPGPAVLRFGFATSLCRNLCTTCLSKERTRSLKQVYSLASSRNDSRRMDLEFEAT
jgi:hypothetical protein